MMDEEQKTMRAYTEWVDDESTQLGFEIKTGKSDIEKLTAEAVKADSDVAELGSAIGKLEGDLSQLEAEKKEATDLRN
jgi:septal ring factor EnvC (AmiA/AmiB activator)